MSWSRHIFAFFVAILAACGGPDVEPLDPKDLTLPPDTRQWIADAQDGVIAARATLDNARARLSSLQKWAASAGQIEFSGSGSGGLEGRLEALTESRLAAATANVAVAEANVELAQRKLDLAYAERSMLHDIASYDLAELRGEVAKAKKQARALTETRREREKRERAAEEGWWKAYSKFAKSGKTDSYWTAGIEPLGRGEQQDSADKASGKSAAKGTRGRVAPEKKTSRKRKRRKKK